MSGLRVQIVEDRALAVAAAATTIHRRLTRAVGRRGRAALAVSGGSTGTELVAALAAAPLSGPEGWSAVDVWQVDERVAPDGDPDRNANALAALEDEGAAVHRMPVTDRDLAGAAGRYGTGLPDRFDVVHLGVGPDGHTASWPPDDPVVDDAAQHGVAIVGPYAGRVRMTLLPGPVNAAVSRVVLVVGADKAAAVAGWVAGSAFDGDLPIRCVHRTGTTLVLDADAAAGLAEGPS